MKGMRNMRALKEDIAIREQVKVVTNWIKGLSMEIVYTTVALSFETIYTIGLSMEIFLPID